MIRAGPRAAHFGAPVGQTDDVVTESISTWNGAPRTLADLRAGESARVAGVAAEWESAKRLADMGFIRGARIDMLRRGSPCLVCIDGTRVGLGLAHQRSLWVEPLEAPARADSRGAPRESRSG